MSTLWVRHASSSAAIARRRVLAACADAGLTGEQALDAALIASELVGNAVRHAAPLPSGQLAVSWLLDSDGYQISVTDGGAADSSQPGSPAQGSLGGSSPALGSQPGRSQPGNSPAQGPAASTGPTGISVRQADARDTCGRGLRIVAELADSWGVDTEAGATTVWARTEITA